DDGPGLDLACNMPVLGCTPSGIGACDPVCQTGCSKCDEKCTINTSGAPACVKWRGAVPPLEACIINNYGQSNQTDDCAPGSVCLRPDPTFPSNWCFAHCATDKDCPGSRC